MKGKRTMTSEAVALKNYPDNSKLLDLAEQYFAALDRDAPVEEIREITKHIPVDPRHALFMKEQYGKDFLIEGKFNLALANAEYGEGWLNE